MTAEVCKYFLSGSCHHGKSCSFSHQKPNAGQKSPAHSVVCKYFLQGKCAYGEKCTRSHNIKGRSKAASDSGSDGIKGASKSNPRKPSIKKQADLSDASSNHEREDRAPSPEGDAQGFSPQKPVATLDDEDKSPSLCFFYTQGLCQSGDSCPFLHSLEPGSNQKDPAVSEQEATSKLPKKQVKETICKHFQRGYCRLGNECKHAHIKSGQSSPIIDKGISGGDQFPPATTTPPSTPGSPAEHVSRELDSGFEDMAVPEDNNSPEGQWKLSAAKPEDSEEVADYDDWRQEQHGEVLDDQPAINSSLGKGKERDTSANGDDPGQWENDFLKSHRQSSPSIPMAQDLQGKANQVGEEQRDDNMQRTRNRKGSYYGDGWEDRELGSPLQPDVFPQKIQRADEHIQVGPDVYPHVSDVKLHWSHFADPLANPKIAFCKLHAQGQCLQGDSCRFRHSLTPEEYTLLFLDQQPNLWTLKRSSLSNIDKVYAQNAPYHVPAAHTQQPDNISENRPQPSAFNASSIECAFFALGKCRNGDICPYRHVQPPDNHVMTSEPGWGMREPISVRTKSSRPCRFYLSKGFCNMGDSCRFQHTEFLEHSGSSVQQSPIEPANKDDNGWGPWEGIDKNNSKKDSEWDVKAVDDSGWGQPVDHSGWGDPQETAPIEQPNKSNLCRQFSRTGHCNRGDSCKFSHDAEPSKSTKESSALDNWPETNNSSPSAPWSVSPVLPCPYFLKGNCKYEETCEYRHERPRTPRQVAGNSRESQAQDEIPHTSTTQNNADFDTEESWNTTWPIQELDSHPTQTKINVPCKPFGQGYCKSGDQCDFLHINNSEPERIEAEIISERQSTPVLDRGIEFTHLPPSIEPAASSGDDVPLPQKTKMETQDVPQPNIEREPIVFNHPEIKRLIMTCEVTVGHDATPERIISASDCTKILLFELPAEVSPSEVTALCGKYGRVQQVIGVDSSPTSSDVRVEFADAVEAVAAARNLNGYIFEGRPLIASLKARIPLTIRTPDAHMLALKVTWPNPSVSAWSHYQTISKAKTEAARLNDTVFRGRNIKTTFVTPLRNQKDSFAIKIERLPPDVTKAEIEELCVGNTLITMNRPSYTEDPVDAISAALDEFRGLEAFDPLPGNSERTMSIAFATFKGESMARAIMEKLDSTQHDFLGNQSLTIRPTYYSRNRILREQLEALQNEIDRLTESPQKRCTIQIDDHPDKNFVWIRIYSPFEHGPSLHAELDELLSGTVLKAQDGTDLWDDYFELPSSAKALKQLNTNAYIYRDLPAQKLKVYGSSREREEVQRSINKLFTKVRSQRHEIELPRPILHPLINGTFTALKADVGLNKVSLDVFNSKLIVRGNPSDVSKANSILESLHPRPAPASDLGVCQICLHKPIDAITLSCHHKYCTPCLQFATQQAGYGPLQCIAQHIPLGGQNKRCPAYVPYVIIRDILPAGEEKQFLLSSFHHHVRSNPNELFFCPSLHCQTTYRRSGEEGVNLKCKFCLSDICTFCKSLAHLGSSCAEINASITN